MNAKDRIQDRVREARECLEEARSLLAEGMDVSFVMNSLYYAMLSSVHALLASKEIAVTTQSVSIAQFDKEFIEPGVFARQCSDTLHRTFALRRTCACETPRDVTNKEAEALLPQVAAFLDAVDQYLSRAGADQAETR